MSDARRHTVNESNGSTGGIPSIIVFSVAFTCGIVAGEWLPTAPGHFLTIALTWLLCAFGLHYTRWCRLAVSNLIVVAFLFGVCRWQIPAQSTTSTLGILAGDEQQTCRIRGTISSVPALHSRSDIRTAGNRGIDQQTRFELQARQVHGSERIQQVCERLLVYVEGDATAHRCGDNVLLTGRLMAVGPPTNPGEFDFARLLKRRRTSALFFVNHPQAIETVDAAGPFNPLRWASELRNAAVATINNSTHPEVAGIALALLLGDRNQVPAETERAFVASGTLHLLAISGLHVGILFAFLLHVGNLLIVKRKTTLLITITICLAYAMVSDLRPSVVRATLFLTIFVTAEFLGRRHQMNSLIALTAVIMLAWKPEQVFNTGAWLSFLAVSGLALVASPKQTRERSEALTWSEWIQQKSVIAAQALQFRYQQMLIILALTAPLVASTFHVISPVGLLVNVLLIPFTAVVLCLGFITLFTGLLIPVVAGLPGSVFSGGLQCLNWIVRTTSEFQIGHLYLSDLPEWFLPVYYLLVASTLLITHHRLRTISRWALYACVVLTFLQSGRQAEVDGIQCTVLNIGHGSAAVIEFGNGDVILVDAGAMHSGRRASDVICRYLWSRGHHSLNTIIISHPDIDHYNAVPEIIARIPTAEIITSRRFARVTEGPAVDVLNEIAERNIPIKIAMTEDSLTRNGCRIRILQAQSLTENASDNEESLVVEVTYRDRVILLPGDIEGQGALLLERNFSDTDVLISPHHGSGNANTQRFASVAKPEHVVVSAGDDSSFVNLSTVFSTVRSLRFTANSGAVTIRISRTGRLTLDEHLSPRK